MGLRSRVIWAVLFVASVAIVVGYQAGQSTAEAETAQPFVPSPRFFLDFSPSFRTTIADAYWLQLIQYYGEHIRTDVALQKVEPMLDVVTELSPGFERGYLFGAYALLDAGLGAEAYKLLERGFAENPDAWRIATNAGILYYTYGPEDSKREVAARWFEKAAQGPGAPAYVSRIAARLLGEGGDVEKATALYAELYAGGDKYSRDKALVGLDAILPKDPAERQAALESVRDLMAPETFDELLHKLDAV